MRHFCRWNEIIFACFRGKKGVHHYQCIGGGDVFGCRQIKTKIKGILMEFDNTGVVVCGNSSQVTNTQLTIYKDMATPLPYRTECEL